MERFGGEDRVRGDGVQLKPLGGSQEEPSTQNNDAPSGDFLDRFAVEAKSFLSDTKDALGSKNTKVCSHFLIAAGSGLIIAGIFSGAGAAGLVPAGLVFLGIGYALGLTSTGISAAERASDPTYRYGYKDMEESSAVKYDVGRHVVRNLVILLFAPLPITFIVSACLPPTVLGMPDEAREYWSDRYKYNL